MRRVRQSGAPDTRKAMPVSHSQKFLCVSFRPADARDQHRIGGIGDVPDLMRLAAEGAQHVDRVGDRPWASDLPSQIRTICAPPDSYLPSWPGMWRRYFGCAGSVTSTIEVPFGSALPVMRIDRHRDVVGAAVMADIGDPAVALMMDGRLIGAARLQVVDSPPASCWRLRAARRSPAAAHRRRCRQRKRSKSTRLQMPGASSCSLPIVQCQSASATSRCIRKSFSGSRS